MTTHKILSLLAFLLITSGCASLNKDPTSESLVSTYSADLGEKPNVEEAVPNSSVNCVPKAGSLFGFSRTCKRPGSLFANVLAVKKLDSSTDAVTKKSDEKSTQNCKIKENTLFGLSRTCESLDLVSNCKIKENTLFGLSRTCESLDVVSKSLSK